MFDNFNLSVMVTVNTVKLYTLVINQILFKNKNSTSVLEFLKKNTFLK